MFRLSPISSKRSFAEAFDKLKFVEHQPSPDSKQKNVWQKNGASFASPELRQTADVRAVYS
jgi:hypothetical protein